MWLFAPMIMGSMQLGTLNSVIIIHVRKSVIASVVI
jgi:hypothetical protein